MVDKSCCGDDICGKVENKYPVNRLLLFLNIERQEPDCVVDVTGGSDNGSNDDAGNTKTHEIPEEFVNE